MGETITEDIVALENQENGGAVSAEVKMQQTIVVNSLEYIIKNIGFYQSGFSVDMNRLVSSAKRLKTACDRLKGVEDSFVKKTRAVLEKYQGEKLLDNIKTPSIHEKEKVSVV